MIKVPYYDDLIGTAFAMFGRVVARDGGLSCQGLVLEMFARAGIQAPDPCENEDADLSWVVVEGPLRPMDVLGLRVGPTDLAGHVALLVEGGKVLHAMRDKGTVLADLEAIKHRIVMVYRWKTA